MVRDEQGRLMGGEQTGAGTKGHRLHQPRLHLRRLPLARRQEPPRLAGGRQHLDGHAADLGGPQPAGEAGGAATEAVFLFWQGGAHTGG